MKTSFFIYFFLLQLCFSEVEKNEKNPFEEVVEKAY